MTRIWLKAAALAVALLAGTGTARADLITTVPAWDGSNYVYAFGESDTATYGQTITVGADNVLNSFSFRLRSDGLNGTGDNNFAAYVAEWDGVNNRITGPLLYSGSQQTLPYVLNGVFTTFTINTGGVQLTTGKQYALFFSASNFFDGAGDSSAWGSISTDTYAGGTFIYNNNGSNFGALTTTSWNVGFGGASDLAFDASLSPSAVPEPSLMAMGAAGLAGVAAVRRRFGRKASA